MGSSNVKLLIPDQGVTLNSQQNHSTHFGGLQDLGSLVSNSFSLAVLACSGIVINIFLAHQFSVAVVGQFNLLLTLYLLIGQLATFGIHLSCLHHLSAQDADSHIWFVTARTAIGAVAVTGAITGFMVFALATPIETILGSTGLSNGLRWLAPTLMLFGINKVLFAIFNADDRLHSLAFVQALRPTVWLASIGILINYEHVDFSLFGQLLLTGELVTTLTSLVLLSNFLRRKKSFVRKSDWISRHFGFGLRALPSHLFIDLNTRIDILVLAMYTNDAVVGVYSFVALLAEGIFQIGVVMRTIVTRRLVRALITSDQFSLSFLKRRAGSWSFLLTMLAAGIVVMGYEPISRLFALDPSLQNGVISLYVLLLGVVICALSSPFWMTLALAGHPIEHSMLMFALCSLNLILNVILVPAFGMIGAAIGTSMMLVMFPVMLSFTTRRVLGLKL